MGSKHYSKRFTRFSGAVLLLFICETIAADAYISGTRGGANALKKRHIPPLTGLNRQQKKKQDCQQRWAFLAGDERSLFSNSRSADTQQRRQKQGFNFQQPPAQENVEQGSEETKAASNTGSVVEPKNKSVLAGASRIDLMMAATYFCTCVGSTLPVILLPMMASEFTTPTLTATSFIAGVASLSTIGGGVGKIINGFVCKAVGGKWSATLYLAGMSISMMALSLNKAASRVGYIVASLDFCSSMLWTACTHVFANHYDTGKHKNAARFAQAMALLSLTSTVGVLSSKLGGTLLLKYAPSWQVVAQFGSAVTLLGSLLMLGVADHPRWWYNEEQEKSRRQLVVGGKASDEAQKQNFAVDAFQALRRVGRSPLFWITGMGHACMYLARSSDRVLGAYFGDVAALPKTVCGLLTASVTLGFMFGIQGKAGSIYNVESAAERKNMLQRKYMTAIVCMGGLATVATTARWMPSTIAAGLGVLLSGFMAASLAVPFYQMPPAIAAGFGGDRSIVTSLLDGFGFFLSAIVWKTTGKIVSISPKFGWSIAFLMVGGFYAIGSSAMLRNYDEIKAKQEGC